MLSVSIGDGLRGRGLRLRERLRPRLGESPSSSRTRGGERLRLRREGGIASGRSQRGGTKSVGHQGVRTRPFCRIQTVNFLLLIPKPKKCSRADLEDSGQEAPQRPRKRAVLAVVQDVDPAQPDSPPEACGAAPRVPTTCSGYPQCASWTAAAASGQRTHRPRCAPCGENCTRRLDRAHRSVADVTAARNDATAPCRPTPARDDVDFHSSGGSRPLPAALGQPHAKMPLRPDGSRHEAPVLPRRFR